jgi:phosphotransferase system enzyme I (PtsI)
MAEARLKGRAASPGFAQGPLVAIAPRTRQRVPSGDPAREAADLKVALGVAAADLARLAGRLNGDAAAILGFQIALAEDPALSELAFAAIARGTPADVAWSAALDAEIAGYDAAEDEHFRARASDLRDLRDRVLSALAGANGADPFPAGAIAAAYDLPPSRFLAIDWSRGGAVLLAGGSATSHVAMLARSRGVPMIVALGSELSRLAGEALVDAGAGEAVIDPGPESRRQFEVRQRAEAEARAAAAKLVDKPARTADGTRIAVQLNIADVTELIHLDPTICDGIGLVRTEFLFHRDGDLPGEDAQYAAYRRIVEWAAGRPVTLRTLDAGGDKPIPGLTVEGESNPFLGVRGLRLSLARPEVFRIQLRALARAAVHGDVKVMLPMVTVPEELARARKMLDEELGALAQAGIAARRPPLGIMVEVPAAAIAIDAFDADFYSLGTNDLAQYVAAAGRDIGAVADLADPLQPAVMRLIEHVARHGEALGRAVSICGDAGGDPAVIPHLLRLGLRSLSVSPAALARVKAAIATVDLGNRGSSPRAE